MQSHCSSAAPASHRDAEFCRKERGFCGLLSVGLDTVKPVSKVTFGEKNRSVASQSGGALTGSYKL